MRNSRRPEAADPLSKVSGTRAGVDGDSPELAALIEDAKGIEDFRVSCHEQRRLLKVTQGGCFGELNYFLQQPRLYSAHVVSAEPALVHHLISPSAVPLFLPLDRSELIIDDLVCHVPLHNNNSYTVYHDRH
jgi:hypothetical protein